MALLGRERIEGLLGGTGIALQYRVPVLLQLSYLLFFTTCRVASCSGKEAPSSGLGLTRFYGSSANLMIERIQAIDLLWDRAESAVKW